MKETPIRAVKVAEVLSGCLGQPAPPSHHLCWYCMYWVLPGKHFCLFSVSHWETSRAFLKPLPKGKLRGNQDRRKKKGWPALEEMRSRVKSHNDSFGTLNYLYLSRCREGPVNQRGWQWLFPRALKKKSLCHIHKSCHCCAICFPSREWPHLQRGWFLKYTSPYKLWGGEGQQRFSVLSLWALHRVLHLQNKDGVGGGSWVCTAAKRH